MNSVRNKLIDKYVKQGMTEDDAIMKADKESQVKTQDQNIRTKSLLAEAGTNAADIEKLMNKNVKRTGEEDWPAGLKKKVGSKKKYPSNLELLMYGKDWWDKKGKNLPKGK